MSGLPVGLVLELVVMVLLSVTVGYCIVLNRRLKRLRTAQDDMRMIIEDLNKATRSAENAVAGLRATAEDAERRLGDKLHKAKLLTHNLTLFVEHSANNKALGGDQNDSEWRQAG